MARLFPLKLFLRRHTNRNRHEAIETTGVIAAVLVLRAAVQTLLRKHVSIVGAIVLPGRDSRHELMFRV